MLCGWLCCYKWHDMPCISIVIYHHCTMLRTIVYPYSGGKPLFHYCTTCHGNWVHHFTTFINLSTFEHYFFTTKSTFHFCFPSYDSFHQTLSTSHPSLSLESPGCTGQDSLTLHSPPSKVHCLAVLPECSVYLYLFVCLWITSLQVK